MKIKMLGEIMLEFSAWRENSPWMSKRPDQPHSLGIKRKQGFWIKENQICFQIWPGILWVGGEKPCLKTIVLLDGW